MLLYRTIEQCTGSQCRCSDRTGVVIGYSTSRKQAEMLRSESRYPVSFVERYRREDGWTPIPPRLRRDER